MGEGVEQRETDEVVKKRIKSARTSPVRVILSGTKWSRTRSATRSVGIYNELYCVPFEIPLRALPMVGFDYENITPWYFFRSGWHERKNVMNNFDNGKKNLIRKRNWINNSKKTLTNLSFCDNIVVEKGHTDDGCSLTEMLKKITVQIGSRAVIFFYYRH